MYGVFCGVVFFEVFSFLSYLSQNIWEIEVVQNDKKSVLCVYMKHLEVNLRCSFDNFTSKDTTHQKILYTKNFS